MAANTTFHVLNKGCLQCDPSGILLREDVHCRLGQAKIAVHWLATEVALTRCVHAVYNVNKVEFFL